MSCKLPLPSNECNGIVYFIGNLKKMLHFSSKLTRKLWLLWIWRSHYALPAQVHVVLEIRESTQVLLWLTVSCIRIKRVITPWSNFKVVHLRTPKSCLFFSKQRTKDEVHFKKIELLTACDFLKFRQRRGPVTPSPFERFFFSVNNKPCN